MINAARSRAEQRFEQIQKRQQKALNEQQQIADDRRAKSARLKAMRLAKEADDIAKATAGLKRARES